mmetsp:Transcript_16153/g.47431  ORF Transcript_16153/g.47431 Transcript_16153/m.47431 type:complete len:257 (+) Transcript_16153:670-1440(+)
MGVLRLIRVDICLPSSSMPRESGVTSRRSRSVEVPGIRSVPPPKPPVARIRPWTAAPTATASSGFMDLQRSRRPWKRSRRASCRARTRVEPPTKTQSLTSSRASRASFKTALTVFMHRSKRGWFSPSKASRVRVKDTSMSSARPSTSTVAEEDEDRTRLAASQAALSRRLARPDLRTLEAVVAPNSEPIWSRAQSTRMLSKSSPPRCVSPPVALTSNTPPSMDSTLTSKVPPPRSKMITFVASCPALPSIRFSWRP